MTLTATRSLPAPTGALAADEAGLACCCAALAAGLAALAGALAAGAEAGIGAVSYTHLTLPTTRHQCRSRWGAGD
nr:hypothetical protein [Chromobacterium sp. ASV5]